MAPIDLTAVKQLKTSLSSSSSILTPESEGYEQSIKRWSDTGERRAGLVVYPVSAKDVAAVVLFSQAHSLELAVCCGGHSTRGSSSTEGGVCLDLSRMRKVVVDPEKKTITVQGGALWADVDSAAAEHGLATVGGTVNHTGVGGLALGGGYGWLTGAYGLAIDNLLEVEFVLADGSIVNASSTKNTDLFWAARGAGACFGVATSFVFKAYEQKNTVWAGLLVFPPPALASIIEFANKSLENTAGKHGLVMGYGCLPPAHQPLLLVVLFYNGSESEGKKFFAPILDIGPLANQMASMPYQALNSILNPVAPHGDRKTQKGTAIIYPMDSSFAEGIFNDYVSFVQKVPDAGRTIVMFECLPAHKLLEVPATETAFANRGAYCNVLVGPVWGDKENDTVCREWSREMASKFQAELARQKALGVDKDTSEAVAEYANYDGLGNTPKAAFGANSERLVSLKKRYDPKNVFNRFVDLLPVA